MGGKETKEMRPNADPSTSLPINKRLQHLAREFEMQSV